MDSLAKIVTAIFTVVIGPIIVWWFTVGRPPSPPVPGPTPIPIGTPTDAAYLRPVPTSPERPVSNDIVFPGGPWSSLRGLSLGHCQEAFQVRTGISSSNTRFDLFGGDFAVGVARLSAPGTDSASLIAYIGSRGSDPGVVQTASGGQTLGTTHEYSFGNRALSLRFNYSGPSAFGGAYDVTAERSPCQ